MANLSDLRTSHRITSTRTHATTSTKLSQHRYFIHLLILPFASLLGIMPWISCAIGGIGASFSNFAGGYYTAGESIA